jgi:hypothetical protein
LRRQMGCDSATKSCVSCASCLRRLMAN